MEIFGGATWVDVAGILISVIGFVAVIMQLQNATKNIKGATHDRVYGHYHNICSIFLERPELRPYFYDNAKLDAADAKRVAEVEAVSEAILGLIEHAVVQRENMPANSWSACWRPYAKERIKKSEVLESYFDPNADWYTEEMRTEFRAIQDEVRRERQATPS